MATGTGNLPYITDPVSPFDTILAETTNEHIANIEAVADGSGIGDGAVTPSKRSGGFHLQIVNLSTGTGSKTITGVPFKPKALMCWPTQSSGGTSTSSGIATDGSPIVQSSTYVTDGGSGENSAAFMQLSSAASVQYRAHVTSFDDDGVTLNAATAIAARSFVVLFLG